MVCSVCDTRGLTLTGQKTTIALEELKEVGVDIEFEHRAISLGDNEQKEPEFLKHNPNGRIPALEDKARGVSVFESAAMCVQVSCAPLSPQPALPRQALRHAAPLRIRARVERIR